MTCKCTSIKGNKYLPSSWYLQHYILFHKKFLSWWLFTEVKHWYLYYTCTINHHLKFWDLIESDTQEKNLVILCSTLNEPIFCLEDELKSVLKAFSCVGGQLGLMNWVPIESRDNDKFSTTNILKQLAKWTGVINTLWKCTSSCTLLK